MSHHFVAFLGVSALVIVTPGQDTALTIRNTLFGGRRSGVFTALGVSTGQAVWTLATSVGIAALLRASGTAFLAVKVAGALYLVFLGVQSLASAFRRNGTGARGMPTRKGITPRVALRQGIFSNLGNPKMAVFFTSLLPQFAEPGFSAFLVLGLIFCSLTLLWLTAYAFVVASAGDLLRRPRIRRALEGVTGAVLVGLGLRLAAERR